MMLNIFSYAAIAIFIITVLYRVIRVANTPAHLRWDLYPVPHEGFEKAKYGGSYYEDLDWWTKPRHTNKFSEISAMIPEILFLKGVWESNRGLWFWSWAFHFGLYLAIGLAGLTFVTVFTGTADGLGKILVLIAGQVGMIGYGLGTLGCLGMLYKRVADDKMSTFTTGGAIFNLLFILAICATGLVALLNMISNGQFGYVVQLSNFTSGLIGMGGVAATNTLFTAHIVITLAFLAYMPFTHMAHFVLKYYTYHSIRWNDEPNVAGSKLEKKLIEALHYKPTWAAKHIQADGKKNWIDIATDEVYRDEK